MKQTLAEQGMYREQESRRPERPEHTEARTEACGRAKEELSVRGFVGEETFELNLESKKTFYRRMGLSTQAEGMP